MGGAVLYIPGKGGSARECEHYKEVFCGSAVTGLSYQTFTPWETGREIREAVEKMGKQYDDLTLVANSIGAFFSLHAGIHRRLCRAYLISPLVDMERMIQDLLAREKVSEEELKRRGVIHTASGEELSWEYLRYVRETPVCWDVPTEILYGGRDALIPRDTVENFAKKTGARLTVMEEGEHWFHTARQMRFLDDWIRKSF